MKKLFLCLLVFSTLAAHAQQKDKINQLISAENFFAAMAKEKGVKQAFLFVSDDNTLVFRPGPVLAERFYRKAEADSGMLSWEPVYAKISKSGDWGFTTGPYTYNAAGGSPAYGDYLSVWKKNSKDVWKLALDIGVPHKKPTSLPKLQFNNAVNDKYMRQYSDIRLKQREELVLNTDQLYSTILNTDVDLASEEFIAENGRLLFPGNEVIIGKTAIKSFWEKQKVKFVSKPVKADRSFSGELAYTHGDVSIEQNGQKRMFHYVRIWEVQAGFKWNVIVEVYTEGEKQ